MVFCRGRGDAVVFGAQAVNVYVDLPRMSQDVDLLSANPAALAASLAESLAASFHIATCVREVGAGKGFRVYQIRKEGNRHLADVRLAEFSLDDAVELDGVRYVSLPILTALKVKALSLRRLAPKGGTDLADLRRLLIAHPELRAVEGPVAEALGTVGASAEAREVWRELVEAPAISDEDADAGY